MSDIKALVLSHGHLDHSLNVTALKRLTGCLVYAPAADRAHLEGTHNYQAISRACGVSEAIGRRLLRYRPPIVDHWFQAGDILSDIWQGLEVIALPGHTAGHSGFFSEKTKTLIVGDLFSNYGKSPKLPPRILNTQHSLVRCSIERAAEIATSRGITKVFLSHGRSIDAETCLRDLLQLAATH